MGSLHEFWNVRKDEVSYGAHGISVDLHACLAAPAMAQGSKGAIKGHVTDASGSVLQGAEVTLEPRSTVLASDVQGEFFINEPRARQLYRYRLLCRLQSGHQNRGSRRGSSRQRGYKAGCPGTERAGLGYCRSRFRRGRGRQS
jgi:hypothetical protein